MDVRFDPYNQAFRRHATTLIQLLTVVCMWFCLSVIDPTSSSVTEFHTYISWDKEYLYYLNQADIGIVVIN
jgi:hypothetical protein